MSKELQDYIAQARKKGFSDKDIYDQLIAADWNAKDVAESLGMQVPNQSPSTSDHPQNKTIFLPVVIRLVIMIIIVVFGLIFTIAIGAIGGSSISFFTPFHIFFLYIPAAYLATSIGLLLMGKNANPFHFVPNKNIGKMLHALVSLLILLIAISFIYNFIRIGFLL